ncbi:hypothetical protein HPB51_005838 [Rhipicephalus microplus]|uniref:SNF2 N-terminal domain-containing protein n=1 Tax=Rhipicephalus microplus TaxID=6941 RepID=A0A9J6DZK3_RHIMP|nr:hypothetical protein HPB51_005838 [Rhipicephalus microplus]
MASAGETDGDDKSSQFKFHKSEGKKLLKQGNVQGALQAFERAAEHQADDRLQAKIEKMREFLKSEQAQEASDSDMVEIGNGFYLCQAIERRLYTYQRTGLLWMWDLYLKKRGGVLGDDMGLGKTIQVIAFLSGMFDSEMIKSVLIIMPVSLIANMGESSMYEASSAVSSTESSYGTNAPAEEESRSKLPLIILVALLLLLLLGVVFFMMSKESSSDATEATAKSDDDGHYHGGGCTVKTPSTPAATTKKANEEKILVVFVSRSVEVHLRRLLLLLTATVVARGIARAWHIRHAHALKFLSA